MPSYHTVTGKTKKAAEKRRDEFRALRWGELSDDGVITVKHALGKIEKALGADGSMATPSTSAGPCELRFTVDQLRTMLAD